LLDEFREVVQVYGEADGSHKGDRWVTRDDTEDLLSLPNTTQIPSMGRGHRTIIIMKDIEDPTYLTVRSAVFDAFEHIGAPGKRPNDQNSDALSGSMAVQSKASGQLTDVVFVVHGIRTYANWIQPLTAKLTAKRPNCQVVDAGYGYFSTLNFLLPWSR